MPNKKILPLQAGFTVTGFNPDNGKVSIKDAYGLNLAVHYHDALTIVWNIQVESSPSLANVMVSGLRIYETSAERKVIYEYSDVDPLIDVRPPFTEAQIEQLHSNEWQLTLQLTHENWKSAEGTHYYTIQFQDQLISLELEPSMTIYPPPPPDSFWEILRRIWRWICGLFGGRR